MYKVFIFTYSESCTFEKEVNKLNEFIQTSYTTFWFFYNTCHVMDGCDLSTKVNCEHLTKALQYKTTIAISHPLPV